MRSDRSRRPSRPVLPWSVPLVLRLARVSTRTIGAGLVALSVAIVAGMVASVLFSPLGDQVFARDGWSNRDHDGDGILHAILGSAAVPSERAAGRDVYPRVVQWRPRHAPASRLASAATGAPGAVPLLRHSVCVRLCDGYYFPVGEVRDRRDVETQTAVCSGQCPGAPTRLFLAPSADGDVDQAVSATDGRRYTALPVAFAHQSAVGPTCGCHPADGPPAGAVSPLEDLTMRSGDSIMTPVGWRVFRGAAHWPYRRADFSRVARATNLSAKTRSALTAMENASLGRRVVAAAPGVPAPKLHLATADMSIPSTGGQLLRRVGPATP